MVRTPVILVRLVHLVYLVCLVFLVERNKPDRPDEPNKPDLSHTRGPMNFHPAAIVFPRPAEYSLVRQGSCSVSAIGILYHMREWDQ